MIEEISQLKSYVRTSAKLRMKAFSKESAAEADAGITRMLFGMPEFRTAQMVFCFAGTKTEINTMPIILGALSLGKRVCVPKCVSKGIMEAREIKGLDDLLPGKFGIHEPLDCCPVVNPEEIAFAVVPCLACDARGNRVGSGGGYYDRFLCGLRLTTAALCRDELLIDTLPAEEHDVPVSIVITEKNVYRPAFFCD